ncbi:hypothetical protein C8F01DRAFT_1099621 [Mycena amicta]|nr:hypothetical protein C8F01DRAFT_1099621 [Mycena amicta]
MFEDYCLTCGKEVIDGRTYCNEVCLNGDLTSPSLSESSSAFSSPHLQCTHGQEVPPLVLAHDRYSASSSSASSTAWSVTDDESDPEALHHGLSYARRPSGINNGKAALHCRTGSGSLQSLALPQSAPDDISSFDQRYELGFDTDADHATDDPNRPPTATITAGQGRKKTNRASLPAYFSMLQINTSKPNVPRASPTVASSAASTLHTRPSPPTPKVGLMAGLAAAHTNPPRGRRRQSYATPSSSLSRSPSPGRRKDSDEKVADWSSGLARGRAIRRNSSPPAKMAVSTDSPHHLRLSISPKRGRARADELEGVGQSPERPGYGHGRSGLIGRARKGAVDEWFGVRG